MIIKPVSQTLRNAKKRVNRSKMHSEEGFTLIEIMVAITLFAVIGALITTTILRLGETTQRFTKTIETQNDAAETSILINRNIATANRILVAEDYLITVRSVLEGKTYDISVFYYDPATGHDAPFGADTTNIPPGSIVQSGFEVGVPDYATFVIVQGYDPSLGTLPLFTYYNTTGVRITTPATDNDRSIIRKVSHQYHISIAERAKPIYVHSSVTPRLPL